MTLMLWTSHLPDFTQLLVIISTEPSPSEKFNNTEYRILLGVK